MIFLTQVNLESYESAENTGYIWAHIPAVRSKMCCLRDRFCQLTDIVCVTNFYIVFMYCVYIKTYTFPKTECLLLVCRCHTRFVMGLAAASGGDLGGSWGRPPHFLAVGVQMCLLLYMACNPQYQFCRQRLNRMHADFCTW